MKNLLLGMAAGLLWYVGGVLLFTKYAMIGPLPAILGGVLNGILAAKADSKSKN